MLSPLLTRAAMDICSACDAPDVITTSCTNRAAAMLSIAPRGARRTHARAPTSGVSGEDDDENLVATAVRASRVPTELT